MYLERYLLFILHVITNVVIKLQSPSQGAETAAKYSFAQCAPCIDKAWPLKMGTGWIMT